MPRTDYNTTTKSFQHDLLPIQGYKSEEIVNGKRFYTMVDGTRYPSITTVLSEMGKDAIAKWRSRVGAEEANAVSKRSTTRGKALHNMCEAFLLNEKVTPSTNYIVNEMFAGFKPVLSHVDTVYGIELPLHSHNLRIAGRTDAYVNIKGRNAIVDYKTSGRMKQVKWITSYILQSTAYSIMIEEMYGHQVDDIVILIGVENEKRPQIFGFDARKYRPTLINYLNEIGHEHTYK